MMGSTRQDFSRRMTKRKFLDDLNFCHSSSETSGVCGSENRTPSCAQSIPNLRRIVSAICRSFNRPGRAFRSPQVFGSTDLTLKRFAIPAFDSIAIINLESLPPERLIRHSATSAWLRIFSCSTAVSIPLCSSSSYVSGKFEYSSSTFRSSNLSPTTHRYSKAFTILTSRTAVCSELYVELHEWLVETYNASCSVLMFELNPNWFRRAPTPCGEVDVMSPCSVSTE